MSNVRDLLDDLGLDALVRLIQQRGLRPSRTLDERRATLSRSYKGGLREFLDDLRLADLHDIIRERGGLFADDADVYEIVNYGSLRKDELTNALIQFFEDGVVPSCFRRFDLGDSSNEQDASAEDSDVDQLDLDGEMPRAPWHDLVVFECGPGAPLPAGIEPEDQPLHDHQVRSLDSLRVWMASSQRSGVLTLPTGAGKTRTAVEFLVRELLPTGKRILWLAHRRELVEQAVGTIIKVGATGTRRFRLSRFEAGKKKFDQPTEVVVASIPTLVHRGGLQGFRKLVRIHGAFDLAVVDECHHTVARSWRSLLQHMDRVPKVLGLSATPTRSDDSEVPLFWKLFGTMIHQEKPLPLMKAGVLARPKIVLVSSGGRFQATDDEQRQFEKFQDLPPSLVRRISEDSPRNELIVRTFSNDVSAWGSTLVFAATIDQARELKEKLSQRGVSAVQVDSRHSMEVRQSAVEAFRSGRVPVLVNVGLFTEGTDVPGVQSVFIARPTRSRILFAQMVGRGLRGPKVKGGTETCSIVTFHDAVLNLSMMHEQLASNFDSEVGALEALGLAEQVAPVDRSFVAGQQIAPIHEADARLAKIRAVLAQRGASPSGIVGLLRQTVAGWHEVRTPTDSVILVVMGENVGEVEAAVENLKRLALSSLDGERRRALAVHTWNQFGTLQRWMHKEHWEQFVSLLLAGGATHRYVDLHGANADALAQLRSSLEAADRAQTPAAAISQKVEPVQGAQKLAAAGSSDFAPEGSRAARPEVEVSGLPALALAIQSMTRRGIVATAGSRVVRLGKQWELVDAEAWEAAAGQISGRARAGEWASTAGLELPEGRANALQVGRGGSVAEQLLRATFSEGQLPVSFVIGSKPPALEAFAQSLKALEANAAREALVAGYDAFYKTSHDSMASYLLEVVVAQLKGA